MIQEKRLLGERGLICPDQLVLTGVFIREESPGRLQQGKLWAKKRPEWAYCLVV